jgi:glutamyl-tRNA synthetase
MLRFAPDLTGGMDIHALRLAIINFITAKQTRTGFTLRIDDITPAHNFEHNVGAIRDILTKFSLPHDHLVYRSTHRHRYQQLAVSLLEQNKAFVCTCAPDTPGDSHQHTDIPEPLCRCDGHCDEITAAELKQIKAQNLPYLICINPPDAPLVFDDALQGEVVTQPQAMGRFAILDADGTPTRDFACAVDDMLGGITMVIEGEEHLSGFARQIHIRNQLGYDQPIACAHLPSFADADSVLALLEEGFLPDAIINALLLSGDNTPAEIFTLPEAIEGFDLSALSRTPERFDRDTLRFLNRAHLRRMDDKAISALYGFADAAIGQLVKLHLEEAATLRELDARIQPFFAPKPCTGKWEKQMRTIAAIIPEIPMFKTFDDFITHVANQTGLMGEDLSHPLRLLLTGTPHGPRLSEVYPLIQSYITEVARCPH